MDMRELVDELKSKVNAYVAAESKLKGGDNEQFNAVVKAKDDIQARVKMVYDAFMKNKFMDDPDDILYIYKSLKTITKLLTKPSIIIKCDANTLNLLGSIIDLFDNVQQPKKRLFQKKPEERTPFLLQNDTVVSKSSSASKQPENVIKALTFFPPNPNKPKRNKVVPISIGDADAIVKKQDTDVIIRIKKLNCTSPKHREEYFPLFKAMANNVLEKFKVIHPWNVFGKAYDHCGAFDKVAQTLLYTHIRTANTSSYNLSDAFSYVAYVPKTNDVTRPEEVVGWMSCEVYQSKTNPDSKFLYVGYLSTQGGTKAYSNVGKSMITRLFSYCNAHKIDFILFISGAKLLIKNSIKIRDEKLANSNKQMPAMYPYYYPINGKFKEEAEQQKLLVALNDMLFHPDALQ